MNRIVEISNVFNSICQLLPDVEFYHFGVFEEINQSFIDNNFANSETPNGKKFPLVFALPPEEQIDYDRMMSTYSWTLVFADLLFYDNAANATTQTIVEQIRNLAEVQTNFFRALKSGQASSKIPYQVVQPISNQTGLFGHNDRLITLMSDFTMSVQEKCNTFSVDFNDLQPPFVYPVTDEDYEKLKPS